MTPADPDNDIPDEYMRGFIGLPDYHAEVTVTERFLAPLPEEVLSPETELSPLFDHRDRFHRHAYVEDQPQRIRETWVNWVREAEAQDEPPQMLSVNVYSHRVDWHTDAPMILVYDKAQRRYLLLL